MSVESSFVNIADLNKLWPTGSDPKSAGDDHLRGVKTVLLNDFAGFTGAVVVTGVDGGAADAYTLTPANALPAYTTKMLIEFTPIATSLTTTPTLNISGLGTKTIKSVANTALLTGDLVINIPTLGIYNGTDILLIGPTKNYVDQLSFSAALPSQSLGFLSSTGAVASFTKSLTFGLNFAKAADVASSATPDIWSGNGNEMHITGTTGITGFAAAPQAGSTRWLYFDGAVLLTNSANFNVQGAANYTTTAGDMVFVYADTTTKFYLLIFKASGNQTIPYPYVHVRNEQTSGTAAATSSAATQNDLVLNTVVGTNSIVGASLTSNTLTLPAGTYDFIASGPFLAGVATSLSRLTLYNSTDSVDIMLGSGVQIGVGAAGAVPSNTAATCSGRFILAASKGVKLRQYTSTVVTLGTAVSSGQTEVYGSLQVWKIA